MTKTNKEDRIQEEVATRMEARERTLNVKHNFHYMLFIFAIFVVLGAAYLWTLTLKTPLSRYEVFRSFIQAGIEPRLVVSEAGIIIIASASAAANCGYTVEELEGRRTTTLVPEPMREKHLASFKRALEEGPTDEVHIIRCQLLKKDKSLLEVELYVRVLDDPEMGRISIATIVPVENIKYTEAPKVEEVQEK